MITGLLPDWRRIPGCAGSPVWASAFDWIERHAHTSEEGEFPCDGQGCLVRVMSYQLKTRSEGRYESHHHTIDLQYTIEGGEGIEIADLAALESLGDYSEEKDVEHFSLPPSGSARVENVAGRFTILFPGEPHMPQLLTGAHNYVRKLVVKIPARLAGLQS